jgi:hypothetical protein
LNTKKLRRLESPPIKVLISPNIVSLLTDSGLNIQSQSIIDLAREIEIDLFVGYKKLEALDETIGGVGLHNVHHPVSDDEMTGNYRIEFRPQFRPIQYVYMWLSYDDLIWNACRIVQDSCLHIENAVKYRFKIPLNRNASLGILLSEPRVKNDLDPLFLNLLNTLNRIVYRKSKHTIEELTIDEHRFTPADALAIYLICRKAGYKLLEPTGLFRNWMK